MSENMEQVQSEPVSTPAPAAGSHEAADNALHERVSAKIDRAIRGVRGPDGKFSKGQLSGNTEQLEGRGGVVGNVQPEGQQQAEGEASKSAPEAPKVDPKFAELEGKFSALDGEHKALKARDVEWTATAEKMLARFESQKDYIAKLEHELAQRGAEVDPRDRELARYKEMERAQQMATERSSWEQSQAAEAQSKQEEAAQYQALTQSTTAALQKTPALMDPANKVHLQKFARLVLNGGDPDEMAALVSASITQAAAAPKPPRTLAGRGAGSLGPKLTDPRDIADKWKQRLEALGT